MVKPFVLLVLSVVLLGCGGDSEPAAQPSAATGGDATTEQACEQAREATASYAAALKTVTTPEAARAAIMDTSSRLRDIDAQPPVDASIDAVAEALSAALEAVDAKDSEAFQTQVGQIQSTTLALSQACGGTTAQ
jgi:hypothetical protein